MCIARVLASDPISLIAAESIVDVGQQASPAAGWNPPIQNVCQRSRAKILIWIQKDIDFASH